VQLTTYSGVKKSTYLHQGQNIHTNMEMWCENSIFLVPYANSFVYNLHLVWKSHVHTSLLEGRKPFTFHPCPQVSKIFFLVLFIHKCQLLPIKIVPNAQLFNVQQTTNLSLILMDSCSIRVNDNWIPHKSCILNIEHF
jgi:hypothetical protein